jgi:hypothetical protein
MSQDVNRRLPSELERIIFEIAAFSYKATALQLVLIARRVQTWIEPIIYQTVMLGLDSSTAGLTEDLFMRTLNSRPSDFFATHVKTLLFASSFNVEIAVDVLLKCTGVVCIGFWINPPRFRKANLRPILDNDSLRPRLLSMDLEELTLSHDACLTRPFFDLHFFSHVTHLEVTTDEGWKEESYFHLLPSLTHLGFDLFYQNDKTLDYTNVQDILSKCKSLVVLAFFVIHDDPPCRYPTLLAFEDPRLVVVVENAPTPYSTWENTFQSTWTDAEDLVAKRKAKYKEDQKAV